MPRPPIDPYWRERVYQETATRGVNSEELARALEAEAIYLGRSDHPSKRSVVRFQSEFRAFPDSVKEQYRGAYWPESFERGALPWAAAPVVAELLRLAMTGPEPRRPSVHHALAVWHLSKVARPGLTLAELDHAGAYLVLAAALPPSRAAALRRELEAYVVGLPGVRGPFREFDPDNPVGVRRLEGRVTGSSAAHGALSVSPSRRI